MAALPLASDVSLNFYTGEDGQAPDPVFESSSDDPPILGYSGTAYVTATPLYLGSAPGTARISRSKLPGSAPIPPGWITQAKCGRIGSSSIC